MLHGKKPTAKLKGDAIYNAHGVYCVKFPRNGWRIMFPWLLLVFNMFWFVKKNLEAETSVKELGDQKGDLSYLVMIGETTGRRMTPLLSWQWPSQWKSPALCSLHPSWLPFPLYKCDLYLLLRRNLHIAHHACRPQIASFCWSQIKQSLLKCI